MTNRFRVLQEADPRDPIAVVAAAGPRSSGRRRANNGAGSSGTPSPESSGKASFYSTCTEQPPSPSHQPGRRRENPDSSPHQPEAGPGRRRESPDSTPHQPEAGRGRRRENPDSAPHQPEAGRGRRRENPPSPLSQPERHRIPWIAPANRAHHLYMAMFALTSVYTIYAYVKHTLTTEGALAERLSGFGSLAYTSGFISVVMTTFDLGSDLVLHLATISAVMGLFGLTVTTLLGVGDLSDSARKMLIWVGLLDAALLMGIEYRRGLARIFSKRHHSGLPQGGRGVGDVEMGSGSSRAGGSE